MAYDETAEPWLRAGAARLVFARAPGDAARTEVRRAQATSPVRVLTPRNAGTGAWAYISTYGGGLLGGDSTDIHLRVEPHALAYLSTQSATKVFRARNERVTTQHLAADIAADALLVLLPDPVCCFAGARFQQRQTIRMEASSSLVMFDWITSGRHARGERWEAAECITGNEIWIDGSCRLRDRVRIPRGGALGMNHFNCLGTLVLLGPRCGKGISAIQEALAAAPVKPGAPVQYGLSPLGSQQEGLILRIAGPDVESVAATIFPLLSFVSEALGEAPWRRKW